jgi:general secretion pathway protein A
MYEQHFGLSGKPFQLNPDPDFFFGSRGHKRALAYLDYGLHKGEGFIVVTGEVGAGKTTLLQGLLRRIPTDSIVAAQIVTTQLEADDLLRMVAASFMIDTAGLDKARLLVALQTHLTALHAAGKRALLIVDEAQNLSHRAVEELRMLSNFQVGTHSLVQSFLVGQPEFRAVMQRPEMQQLKQRIIASYHLGPLDRTETEHYVEHRLAHVGWKRDPAFSSEAFERIHTVSAGIPRRINALCDRLLLAAYLSEKHEIGLQDVEQVSAEMLDELGFSAVQDRAPGVSSMSGRAVTSEDLIALDQRVTSLEASNSLIFDVLKRVLRALRGPTRTDSETTPS